MERSLGDFGSEERGPTLVVVSGLHGNEEAGVRAADRAVRALEGRADQLRGRAVFLVGNLTALGRGIRYLDRDLNRAWTPATVNALRNGARPADGGAEDREQRELLARLDPLVDGASRAVYVLDLHTTSGPGGPFATVADTLENRALALALPVPLVLGLEELVDGTLHDYLGQRGCVTVAFESGQHAEASAVERAEAAIWIVLAETGILDRRDAPELGAARALLARDGRVLPRVLEMRYRHALADGDGFRMRPGYRSFQRIRQGEVLARDVDGPVRSPESARLLMPLYQTQGEDGFFVVREFNPFWLGLSRVLRRAGLTRVVHWLPGIRRHPELERAYVVNRRVARWYALQILHLLGFRRRYEDGNGLVVLRRH